MKALKTLNFRAFWPPGFTACQPLAMTPISYELYATKEGITVSWNKAETGFRMDKLIAYTVIVGLD